MKTENDMFLDDQIYKMVKQSDVEYPEDFQILVNNLYKLCENYYKAKLTPSTTYKEATQIIDKTFKFWDMAMVRLDKEDWWLIDLLRVASFRGVFMKNEKLKTIYERGK